MIDKKVLTFVFISIISVNSYSGVIQHRVKSGESLSMILHKYGYRPIYGKNGYLIKIISFKKNKKLLKKKGNHILPNQVIFLVSNSLGDLISIESDQHAVVVSSRIDESSEFNAWADINVLENKNSESASKNELVRQELDKHDETIFDSLSSSQSGAFRKEPRQFNFIKITPSVTWYRLQSDRINSDFKYNYIGLTRESPTMLLEYGLNPRLGFDLSAYASFGYMRFNKIEGYSLKNRNVFKNDFGLQSNIRLTKRDYLNFGLGFHSIANVNQVSDQDIEIDNYSIPRLRLGYGHRVFSYKRFNFFAGIDGDLYFPMSYPGFDSELSLGVGGKLSASLGSSVIQFFYNNHTIKAKNKSTQLSELGWRLIFEGRFYE